MGCFVTGHQLDATGKPLTARIRIRAERAGFDALGNYYAGDPVMVSPEAKRGQWKIELTPSSIVGAYTVTTATGGALAMWVPDERACAFVDAVRLAEERAA